MNAVQKRFLLRIKKSNSRKQGREYRVTAHSVVKWKIINKLMGRTYNRQTTMTLMIKTHIPHWRSTYQLFQKQACRFLGSRGFAGIRSCPSLTGEESISNSTFTAAYDQQAEQGLGRVKIQVDLKGWKGGSSARNFRTVRVRQFWEKSHRLFGREINCRWIC